MCVCVCVCVCMYVCVCVCMCVCVQACFHVQGIVPARYLHGSVYMCLSSIYHIHE